MRTVMTQYVGWTKQDKTGVATPDFFYAFVSRIARDTGGYGPAARNLLRLGRKTMVGMKQEIENRWRPGEDLYTLHMDNIEDLFKLQKRTVFKVCPTPADDWLVVPGTANSVGTAAHVRKAHLESDTRVFTP
jgi:hypothetical protein